LNNVQEFSFYKFFYYLSVRGSLSTQFKKAIFYLLVFQITILSFSNASDSYWSKDEKISRMIYFIRYISFLEMPFFSISTFISLIHVIGALYIADVIIFVFCFIFFFKNRTIPYSLVSFYQYFSTILNTVILPLTSYSFGVILNDSFYPASIVSSNVGVFLVLVFMLFTWLRLILFVEINQSNISFHRTLFFNFSSSSVLRILFSLSLVSFLGRPIKSNITIHSYVPIASIIIISINLYYEFLHLSFLNPAEKCWMQSGFVSHLFIATIIYLSENLLFLGPSVVFWLSITIFVVFVSILPKINEYFDMKSLDRLHKDDYFNENPPERTAIYDLYTGFRFGDERAISPSFISSLFEKFPDSFSILSLVSSFSLTFTQIPVTNAEVLESLRQNHPFSPHIWNYRWRLRLHTGPENYESQLLYERKINLIFEEMRDLMTKMIRIGNTLLNETYVPLPSLSLEYLESYERVSVLLFDFLIDHPKSKHGKFFVKTMKTIYPWSKELEEQKTWYDPGGDHISDDVSAFPNHVQTLITHPSVFRSLDPVYSTPFPENMNIVRKESMENINQRKFSSIKDSGGPFTAIFRSMTILIPMIITWTFPIFLLPFITINSDKSYVRLNHILYGHEIIKQLNHISTFVFPLHFYISNSSLLNSSSFRNISLYSYRDCLIRNISNVQIKIEHFSTGFGLDRDMDKDILLKMIELLSQSEYYPLLSGNFTMYHAIFGVTLLSNGFLIDEPFFKQLNGSISTASILFGIHTIIDSIGTKVITELNKVEINDYQYSPAYIIIISIAIMSASGFSALYFFIKAGKQLELFFQTLRDTSKSSVKAFTEYFQKQLDNYGKGSHDKSNKMQQQPIYAIAMLFVAFWAIQCCLFSSYILLSNCYNARLSHIREESTKYVQEYHVFSYCTQLYMALIKINLSQSTRLEVVELMNNLIENYIPSLNHQPLNQIMCSRCNESIRHRFYSGSTYESIFMRYLAMISMSPTLKHMTTNQMISPEDLVFEYINHTEPSLLSYHQSFLDYQMEELGSTKIIMYIIIVMYFIFSFSGQFLWVYLANEYDKPFKAMLQILTRLPESALSVDTLRILSEQSNSINMSDFQFDTTFYDQIVNSFPDPIIVVNCNQKITFANSASHFLTGSEAIGKTIFDTLKIELMVYVPDSQSQDAYHPNESVYLRELLFNYLFTNQKDILEYYVYGASKTHKYYYNLAIIPLYGEYDQIMVSSSAKQIALIFNNISEEEKQKTLIDDETKKYRTTLGHILPKKILDIIVTNPKKSISFAVRNVTVSFCDIVQFTPWCAKQEPDAVVGTMNYMFSLFDSRCSKYPHLTKIKTIGDSYMSAAGVFDSDEKPNQACQEMINFGLDLIDAIKEVNKAKGTELQVRIGAAFGGPISAGVLGIHKPVFDIWGGIVNLAQKMESSGSPMKVHITPETYEFVKELPLNFELTMQGNYLITRPESFTLETSF